MLYNRETIYSAHSFVWKSPSRSKLILLQTLFCGVAAASSFCYHLLDSPVVLLLMPGMIAAIALSGNVHAFPIWVAACGNFVFYFFLLWLATVVWKKVWAKIL